MPSGPLLTPLLLWGELQQARVRQLSTRNLADIKLCQALISLMFTCSIAIEDLTDYSTVVSKFSSYFGQA